MNETGLARAALEAKSKADRVYLHYALALSILLIFAGTGLIVAGIGGQLDLEISSKQGLEARAINASPGVVLWLVGAAVFAWARPRKVTAFSNSSEHQGSIGRTTPPQTRTLVLGKNPNSGANIKLISGKWGPYVQEEGLVVSLLYDTEEEEVDLDFAVQLIEQERRLFSEGQASARKLNQIEIYRELGRSPFTGKNIAVFQVSAGAILVGDGFSVRPLPEDRSPFSLSRYEAIELLRQATTAGETERLNASTATQKPPGLKSTHTESFTFEQRVNWANKLPDETPD